MANAPNFAQDVLDKDDEEIERPKPWPVGSYVCIVKGLPEYANSTKKQTPYARFHLQPIQAMDDVDAEALDAMGGFGERTIRATYYLTEDAAYRAKEFADHCGVPAGGKLRSRLEACNGCQVIAVMKHTMNDSGNTYAELDRTAAVS